MIANHKYISMIEQIVCIYDRTLVCLLLQAWAHSQLIVSMHKHKHIYDSKKIGQSDGVRIDIPTNSMLARWGFYT